MLKYRQNYEIMTPGDGRARRRTAWCSASTPAATRSSTRLQELGIDTAEIDMNQAFERFKALADTKKNVYDEDLIALVAAGVDARRPRPLRARRT